MRDTRKQAPSIGSGSGVAARRGLELGPGKRTLTEGLPASPHIGGQERTTAVAGEVESQCIGEDFARGISNEVLERTLIRDATAGGQELAGILQQLAGNRGGSGWGSGTGSSWTG